MIRVESVSISTGPIKAEFKPTNEERDAAWRILVDLGTSIATQPFLAATGHIRDVLTSLHRIFHSTKQILKDMRPSRFDGDMNFASVCMSLLTQCLGPFLAKWHEPLNDYETSREKPTSERAHELSWPQRAECLSELRELQRTMHAFTQLLSELAGVRLNEA